MPAAFGIISAHTGNFPHLLQKASALVVQSQRFHRLPTPFRDASCQMRHPFHHLLPDDMVVLSSLSEHHLAMGPSLLSPQEDALYATKSYAPGDLVFSETNLGWYRGQKDTDPTCSFVWQVLCQSAKGKTTARMATMVEPRTE